MAATFVKQVLECSNGMAKYHAWPCVAHNLSDCLALYGVVAEALAVLAEGLCTHLATLLSAVYSIAIQQSALWTEQPAAVRLLSSATVYVHAFAIDDNHLRDGALFASSPFLSCCFAAKAHAVHQALACSSIKPSPARSWRMLWVSSLS